MNAGLEVTAKNATVLSNLIRRGYHPPGSILFSSWFPSMIRYKDMIVKDIKLRGIE